MLVVCGLGLLTGAAPTGVGAVLTASRNVGANAFSTAASFCVAGSQTVTATADATVKDLGHTQNFGGGTTLDIKSSYRQDQRVLVQFALPALASGCTVSSAKLQLRDVSVEATRTFPAFRVAEPWSESTVTWDSQPATAGASQDQTGSTGGWTEWPVTALVSEMYASGNFGFLVRDSVVSDRTSTASGTSSWSSREGANAPRLVLVTG